MPRAAGGGAKKTAPKAHKLAVQFPKDLVLRDLFKKEWVIGDVVGKGGFGLIYLASEKAGDAGKGNGDKVIKIEPKENGPLFCEMQFYQRVAKSDQIRAFVQKRKLQYLPVPPFLGTGSHSYNSKEYRFLVVPRYGTDLHKLLVQAGGTFPAQAVFAVGLRIIDALEYMHEHEYVHADVKAANILQGYQNGKILPNQVYLVDYGLAWRYTVDNVHKEYKEDPRKAHDGTIEFTSRDSHKGVAPSRRADLEILGYCLLQWLAGKLPWENKLTDPNYVASCKENFFKDIPSSISSCFSTANPNSAYSDVMVKFLDVVKKMKYEDTPKYSQLKGFLLAGLTKTGQKNEWTINFASNTKVTKRKSTDGRGESPVKKAKTSESPKKRASPKKKVATPKTKPKIITPMTPKSPAKSPKVPASSKNGRAKSPEKIKSPAAKAKRPAKRTKSPSSSSKSKAVCLDTPLTRHYGNGDTAEASSSVKKSNPMSSARSVRSPRSPAVKKTVKRSKAVKSDACIQTSPGLALKR